MFFELYKTEKKKTKINCTCQETNYVKDFLSSSETVHHVTDSLVMSHFKECSF